MLMFQGSNDLELASFFGLDEIDFVDKWAVLTQDDPQGSPSSSSHDLTDLLIRPGLMRPGYSSTLPLSDPDSMDQLEINDPNELEILTKKGTVRKDMTPWRRAVVVRKAKESNQKLRGMQVHKFSEGQWEGDSEEDIAPIRMRRMRPIIIERRLDHDR